jgi:hypothetical protein
MIYCAKKEDYVDQNMTCIKMNCPYYHAEKDECNYENKKENTCSKLTLLNN